MKICIIGLGYIGFPTACLLAEAGHQVIGVDRNPKVLHDLSNGRIHVDEVGLRALATTLLHDGALSISPEPKPADVFIICVPTPAVSAIGSQSRESEGADNRGRGLKADLSLVVDAMNAILPYISTGSLIILESTVPPRTTTDVLLPLIEHAGFGMDEVHLVHAPERVLPGDVLREMRENDRVIGGVTPDGTRLATDLYSTFVTGEIYSTDATTAELVKLMENAFRDVNIALANEFGLISERLRVDVEEAIRLANRHPRVNILSPGPGVGGHCIPIDPHFIIQAVPDESHLLQCARRVNASVPSRVVNLVRDIDREYGVRRVVVLGASYKADVADTRESPSGYIVGQLLAENYAVVVHDPYIEDLDVDLEEACRGAELLVLVTDHSLYKSLDPQTIAKCVSKRLVLDTRRALPKEKWEEAGFLVRRQGDGTYIRDIPERAGTGKLA